MIGEALGEGLRDERPPLGGESSLNDPTGILKTSGGNSTLSRSTVKLSLSLRWVEFGSMVFDTFVARGVDDYSAKTVSRDRIRRIVSGDKDLEEPLVRVVVKAVETGKVPVV